MFHHPEGPLFRILISARTLLLIVSLARVTLVLASVQRETVSSGLRPMVGIGDEYASDDDDLNESDDAPALLARQDPGDIQRRNPVRRS
jgi:hypothetical protein